MFEAGSLNIFLSVFDNYSFFRSLLGQFLFHSFPKFAGEIIEEHGNYADEKAYCRNKRYHAEHTVSYRFAHCGGICRYGSVYRVYVKVNYDVHKDYERSAQGVAEFSYKALDSGSHSRKTGSCFPFHVVETVAYHCKRADIDCAAGNTAYNKERNARPEMLIADKPHNKACGGAENAGENDYLFVTEFFYQRRHCQHRAEHSGGGCNAENSRNKGNVALKRRFLLCGCHT